MNDVVAKAKRHGLALVAEIDRDELAVRMMECAIRLLRPDGKNATDIMDEAEEELRRSGYALSFRDMADIAISYLNECVKAGQQPS